MYKTTTLQTELQPWFKCGCNSRLNHGASYRNAVGQRGGAMWLGAGKEDAELAELRTKYSSIIHCFLPWRFFFSLFNSSFFITGDTGFVIKVSHCCGGDGVYIKVYMVGHTLRPLYVGLAQSNPICSAKTTPQSFFRFLWPFLMVLFYYMSSLK